MNEQTENHNTEIDLIKESNGYTRILIYLKCQKSLGGLNSRLKITKESANMKIY